MSGFFSRLFGGGSGGDNGSGDPASLPADETYKDVEIRAAPMKADGGQWRIAGTLTRHSDDGSVTRRFIRADLLNSRDEAAAATLAKAKLIIDQNGASLWSGNEADPV